MMSEAWSQYVIALTTIMMVGIIWVLFANRRGDGAEGKTTGHEHDGIEEYDNPLPLWWFYLFVISIVFSIVYLIFFPGMGNYPGLLNWTSIDKWEQEQQQAEQKYSAVFARYRDMPIEQLHQERAAMKMAQRVFANNCAQCHGVDAKGSLGFPDLSDKDWLYGGAAEQISHSIQQGRVAAMPAWGQILGEQGVTDTAHYVLKLSAADHDSERAKAGEKSYQSFCIACHGANGAGNPLLGAANISDSIWLYGGDLTSISESIRNGRNGVMPAHANKINPDKLHLLSAYVYGLSRR